MGLMLSNGVRNLLKFGRASRLAPHKRDILEIFRPCEGDQQLAEAGIRFMRTGPSS